MRHRRGSPPPPAPYLEGLARGAIWRTLGPFPGSGQCSVAASPPPPPEYGQRRGRLPSSVRARYGAVKQGQSGGSVGTTSRGKGRVSGGVRVGQAGGGRAQGGERPPPSQARVAHGKTCTK